MIDKYIIQPFIDTHKGKNIFFIFVVICLVLAEKFIEADFVCPCEKIYRGLFFGIYLVMPAFVAYVAMLCILINMDKRATQSRSSDVDTGRSSNLDNQSAERGICDVKSGRSHVERGMLTPGYGSFDVESGRSCVELDYLSAEHGRSQLESRRSHEEQENQSLISVNHSDRKENAQKKSGDAASSPYGQSFMAAFVCFVLFFSDGRYVACITTALSTEHAVSSKTALCEWCDTNRNLTANQNKAETSYYASKLSGFGFIFVFSFFALVYQLKTAWFERCSPCCSSCCKGCCSPCCQVCCDATPDELTSAVVETDG